MNHQSNNLKFSKNPKFEVGDCSKSAYIRKMKLNNQKWIVKKSDDSSSNDSDSSKSEELLNLTRQSQ
ncbi:hypothetical protein Hanom_Chr03g00209451 [Helianthus anomalus]